MQLDGYTYSVLEFARLLIAKHYPERTDGESAVIRAYLLEHLSEFDSITFAKRVGRGIPADPTHEPGVQANAEFSGKLKIDILAYKGSLPYLIEVKQRVTPAALGQILTYRHEFLEEFPDAPEPSLVVVGREASENAIPALQAHGVTIYLYPDADPRRDAAGGGLRPDGGTAA
jgi:hypothetical protein